MYRIQICTYLNQRGSDSTEYGEVMVLIRETLQQVRVRMHVFAECMESILCFTVR